MLTVLNAVFLIPWKTIEPGSSFFIPCLDIAPHVRVLEAEAKRWGKRICYKRVIESGKYGLRTWVVE
jgi:hypothetical protein